MYFFLIRCTNSLFSVLSYLIIFINFLYFKCNFEYVVMSSKLKFLIFVSLFSLSYFYGLVDNKDYIGVKIECSYLQLGKPRCTSCFSGLRRRFRRLFGGLSSSSGGHGNADAQQSKIEHNQENDSPTQNDEQTQDGNSNEESQSRTRRPVPMPRTKLGATGSAEKPVPKPRTRLNANCGGKKPVPKPRTRQNTNSVDEKPVPKPRKKKFGTDQNNSGLNTQD